MNGRARPAAQAVVCDACGRRHLTAQVDGTPECHTRSGDPYTVCDGTRPPLTRRIPGATNPPRSPR